MHTKPTEKKLYRSVIRDFFATRGVAGEVFDRPWRDFGGNRSEALALARVHAHANSDYLWMFDADDVIEGSLDLTELTADAYQLRLGPDIEYWRLQIFRRALPWRFVGVLHEYPVCATPDHRTERIDGAYQIVSRRLGSRSNDPQKYRRDAVLLELVLQQEPENARYAFYLAQSWFDAGELAQVIEKDRDGGWFGRLFG